MCVCIFLPVTVAIGKPDDLHRLRTVDIYSEAFKYKRGGANPEKHQTQPGQRQTSHHSPQHNELIATGEVSPLDAGGVIYLLLLWWQL